MESMKNQIKGSIIIAVTSQNYRTVTKHAGLTRKFLVYDVRCSDDNKTLAEIKEIDRISLPKEDALHSCKSGVVHLIDVADVIVCGSCGEGFIKKMSARDIAVSVATKSDPIEAIEEYLSDGERYDTCDGPQRKVVKRHPNCPHNKEHAHTLLHAHKRNGHSGCGGHGHNHNHKCECGDGCSCKE